MAKRKCLVGSDPEFFLIDSNFGLVSSVGLIGGNKEYPASMGRDGFFVQEDNVAVEINIPPAASAQAFVNSITWAKTKLELRLKELGLKLYIEPHANFPESELQSPQAQVFGCDPDFNVWENGTPNPKPLADFSLRTAGGHVHIGWENPDMKFRFNLGRVCDLILGVPSVILDKEGKKRQSLYGQAGACRFPKYGLEYRVLSNFWLRTKDLTKWAYNQAVLAFDKTQDEEFVTRVILDKDRIVNCINSYNRDSAKQLCKEYQIVGI